MVNTRLIQREIEQQLDILYPILNDISPISATSWNQGKIYFQTQMHDVF